MTHCWTRRARSRSALRTARRSRSARCARSCAPVCRKAIPIRSTPRRWGNMSRGTAAMRWRAFWLSSKSARPNSKDNNLTSPRLSMGRRFRLFGRFLDHHLLVDAGLGIGAQAHHHRFKELQRQRVVIGVERQLVVYLAKFRAGGRVGMIPELVAHVAVQADIVEEIMALENAVMLHDPEIFL